MCVRLDTQLCAYGDGGCVRMFSWACVCVCAGREEAGGAGRGRGQTALEDTDEAGPQLGQAHAQTAAWMQREGRTYRIRSR